MVLFIGKTFTESENNFSKFSASKINNLSSATEELTERIFFFFYEKSYYQKLNKNSIKSMTKKYLFQFFASSDFLAIKCNVLIVKETVAWLRLYKELFGQLHDLFLLI